MLYALAALAVIAVLLISLYNKLARQKLVVNEASADIETFLKQRYDMIPNLVETVKGYAKHEKETFTELTEMRSKAMSVEGLEAKAEYENKISQAVTKLFAVAENYPDLKANQNFINLQNNLREMEDNIQKSRRFYNGAVRDFNTMIAVFPNNLIAGIFGYKDMPFFEASEEEQKNVEVKF